MTHIKLKDPGLVIVDARAIRCVCLALEDEPNENDEYETTGATEILFHGSDKPFFVDDTPEEIWLKMAAVGIV